jgi:hypothetical protein
MPALAISPADLLAWGAKWMTGAPVKSVLKPYRFGKKDGMDFGYVFDQAVGEAMAVMLGNGPVGRPTATQLLPVRADCVEVGPVRVVGGVRPQNFDVGYRPDGIRIAYDSKTLNDGESVGKNWQNMINDLATEATTVHSRFNSAIVAFIWVVPVPCFRPSARTNSILGTLTRLGGRELVSEPPHRAEALSVIAWDPATGLIDPNVPDPSSPLRYERFSDDLYRIYHARFQGLPPHAM